MLEFSYDGKVKSITASDDCVVSFALKGGGGGGGGMDSPGKGSAGTEGSLIMGQISMVKDSTIYAAVGGYGGGALGTVAGRGAGAGGLSLDGFSGGTGGNAGPSGTSGSGGGGGGATVLYKMVNGTRTILAVAGGGAGGGGGGHVGASEGYLLPESQYTYFPEEIAGGGLYYTNADVNWNYCQFLNTLGIWNYAKSDNIFLWDAYLTAGSYTVNLSADNFSYLTIDEIPNAFNDAAPGLGSSLATPNGTEDAYTTTHTKTMTVTTTGWYTVRVYAVNYGGPASVAFLISKNGTAVLSSRSAYNLRKVTTYVQSRGGQGQNHQGDGGGPGGGGGGYPGGKGSNSPIYDIGAAGGTPGYSYKNTAAGVNNGYWAGNASYYGIAGYHIPAGNAYDGSNGYAGFTSSVNNSISVKSGNNWVKPSQIYIKQNGSWVSPSGIYIKQNGEWKPMYGDPLSTYTDVAATFNRVSGPPNPYPEDVFDTGVPTGGGGSNTFLTNNLLY